MILACDQHDQTIRVAYGNDLKEVHIEEYLEHEKVLHRLQELGKKAARIVLSNENTFTSELEGHRIVTTRVRRLEATYWGLREELNGEDCLILSVGLSSCIAGLVRNGTLVTETTEPNLALRQVWQDLLNTNPPLKQAAEILIARSKEPSKIESEIFRGFLSAFRGTTVQTPIPFLAPLTLPHAVKGVLDLLSRLDPQNEVKALILADWAVFGSLAQHLWEHYQLVASWDNPFETALRGMISLGLKDLQATKQNEDFQALLASFHTQYAKKNYDACLETLKQITIVNPSYPESRKLLALVEEALSKLQKQREKEQKSFANAALKTARKQYDEGDLDRCKETLGTLLRDHPTDEKTLRLQEELNTAIQERNRLQGLLGKVAEYLSRKQYRKARHEYHRILTNSDVRNQSWAKDSISSIETEFTAHRATLHKRVLAATAALLAAALLATYLSVWNGKPPTPASPPGPAGDYIQKMISLAEVNGGIGREPEILEAWNNVKRMNLKNRISCSNKRQARDLNDMGNKYSKQEKHKEASRYYNEALQACENDVEITSNVGYTFLRLGRLGDAETYLFRVFVFPSG